MLDKSTYTQPGDIVDAPPLHHFVEGHRDALRNAGELLLGFVGIALVDNLIDRLGRENAPSRATWRLLDQLHDLLTLRHVHDPDRPEAGFCAGLDPARPEVEEICLLSDGLATVMRATPRTHSNGHKPDVTGLLHRRSKRREFTVESRRPRRVSSRRIPTRDIITRSRSEAKQGRRVLSLQEVSQ